MLEEDALRFDQFLKDNDQKAVQAIKRAEAETKAKSEKVAEIKKLNMQITQIKSEMSKFEEQLEDCRKYVWPDCLWIASGLPPDCLRIDRGAARGLPQGLPQVRMAILDATVPCMQALTTAP